MPNRTGLATPMLQMNRRNLLTAIRAEAAASEDPLAYFRKRMAEPAPKGKKKFEVWQNKQRQLRDDLKWYINKGREY